MIPVAVYCRVSTDHTDQIHSFESQKRYFEDYIRSNPDWSLSAIYADEGISGTDTKKRTQFNRMMNDAYERKFLLIVTKEVSRFSRNILDTIAYTRELKSLGIGVFFASDRIHTLEPEAEMLLSFLAAMAQEESRRTSARVVWGQTRRMERGVVFGRSLLGYDVKQGILTVEPEGAEIVRLIFSKYAREQMGTAAIARYLMEQGYRTSRGRETWTASAVIKILSNEKYVGDLVQKKTYTPDYLTHQKQINRGQVPRILLENHHEAIVSRELWDMAQQLRRRNNKQLQENTGHSNRYVFSGKIICGVCGSRFVGRIRYRKDGTKIRRWCCGKAVREGKCACSIGKLVRDDDAMEMLKTALRSLSMVTEAVADRVTQAAVEAIRWEESSPSCDPKQVQWEMAQLRKKKEKLLDSWLSGDLSREDMQAMHQRYQSQLEACAHRLSAHPSRQEKPSHSLRRTIRRQLCEILSGKAESEAFYKTVTESLTVCADHRMELRLTGLRQIFCFD